MTNLSINENSVKILEYNQSGELPNPFIFNDGTLLTNPNDWEKRRNEIYEAAVGLQFGKMPPEPEFLEVEPLSPYGAEAANQYRIITGRRDYPISFKMSLYKNKFGGPVVITGDGCWGKTYYNEFVNPFAENKINLVIFDRTELAPDISDYNIKGIRRANTGEYQLCERIFEKIEKGECCGLLKRCYPDYEFNTIAAWAWGYSRCVDALEILGYTDNNLIAFTGHSRGAKTCALAGAVDTRATIVNPNASCAGGYSSYRINTVIETEDGTVEKNEDLAHICRVFPAWLGQGMKEYIGRENELPFDSHYLKALVAPRTLLVTEGASDIMANPVGSYQTTIAAGEVYKFLGVEDKLVWHFRSGKHKQGQEDIQALIDVIKRLRDGTPLGENFYKRPFTEPPKAYSWKNPNE